MLLSVSSTDYLNSVLNKVRRTVCISEETEKFIERHRGAFSFSAYTEYLLREAIGAVMKDTAGEERADARPRRAVLRVR